MTGAERLLLACVTLLLAAGPLRAQDVVIRESGSQYVFYDEEDPDLAVIVGLGGILIERGGQRILADTMVLLVDGSAGGADADTAAGGQVISEERLLEAFFDGDVSLEEGDEITAGAASVHIDNTTGLVTLFDGSWRSSLTDQPVILRFELMRSFVDGSHEVEGAKFTTCDYAHAHWGLETPWVIIEPTIDGRVLKTSRTVGQVGDVPLLPLPGFHMNIDRQRPPLRRVAIGNSTRFGFEIQTEWGGDATDVAQGVGRWFDARVVEADWQLNLDSYSKRGMFTEPSVSYRTENSFGRILGSYIKDSQKTDQLDRAIEDSTRGRLDITHRTRIDEKQVVDFELSYLSDRGYLREYYETENRNEKPQETYINYRHVDDNVAWQVLVRDRLNDYDTQVESLPRVERRQVAEGIDLGPLGEGFWNGRDFFDVARLQEGEPEEGKPDPPAGSLSTSNTRIGSRREVTVPFDLGEDRVTVSAAVDLTGFDKTASIDPVTGATVEDNESQLRYALAGSVGWSRTYSGVDSELRSETWNMDGVRQILEPGASFNSVLEINERPPDLLAIDDTEALDKLQVFLLSLRHRVQTHQAGQVATVLDSQVTMPVFTNERRDNNGDTMGLTTFDTRWRPGANVWGLRKAEVQVRTTVDPNDQWSYRRSFASYTNSFSDRGRVLLRNDKVAHRSNFGTLGIEWDLTPKWTGAFYMEQDLREKESNRRGILLRQQAHRWLIDIELAQRRADSSVNGSSDVEESISIRFRPAALADTTETLLSRITNVRQR